MPDETAAPRLVATHNPTLSVYRPPMPETVDPDQWAATHAADERYVAECLDIGEPPRLLGVSKRRERVCVRAGLFFREYEWREWEELNHYYPWYLFESWRLPDGRKVARKCEITEQLARDMIERGEVQRGPVDNG